MTLDEALRALVRDEVRKVVREELERALGQRATAGGQDEYLTYKQAGAVANVSVGTIQNWMRQGLLQPCGVGRSLRIRRSELDKVMVTARKRRTPTVAEEVARILAKTGGR